jgi:hypothetical protein
MKVAVTGAPSPKHPFPLFQRKIIKEHHNDHC